MKASILAFYLSVLAPLIAGSAIPETQGHPDYVSESPYPAPVLEDRSVETLEKRRVHWVRLCTEREFQPHCANIPAEHNVCVPLGNDLEDRVSSIEPAQGAYCRFYFHRGGQFGNGQEHFDLVFPGVRDLGSFGDGRANDQVSSYQCWDN